MDKCPKKGSTSSMGEKRTQLVQEEDTQSVTSSISKVKPKLDRENIMLRRTLLKVPSVAKPPQRKSLFKTTYRSHGKICRVIVDFGSMENIVSIEMVDKLKLRRKPHTTLYKVSWLSKGQHIVCMNKLWWSLK